jgi:hypothetical protein
MAPPIFSIKVLATVLYMSLALSNKNKILQIVLDCCVFPFLIEPFYVYSSQQDRLFSISPSGPGGGGGFPLGLV